ncbi:MAG: hypothetical protein M0R76_07050 [Proteobacteria bacterium]|jgi:hypothetical protein|nr:hypothetical protein [Pseudomonadota bacterium]NLN63129.1 hypothetical protein [Myxococcales bacterium]
MSNSRGDCQKYGNAALLSKGILKNKQQLAKRTMIGGDVQLPMRNEAEFLRAFAGDYII